VNPKWRTEGLCDSQIRLHDFISLANGGVLDAPINARVSKAGASSGSGGGAANSGDAADGDGGTQEEKNGQTAASHKKREEDDDDTPTLNTVVDTTRTSSKDSSAALAAAGAAPTSYAAENFSSEEESKVRALLLACYNNIAFCALRRKAYAECVRACDAALDLQPLNTKALYRRALARWESPQSGATESEMAVADLRAALVQEPK
jgi:hypothetical protein